MIVEHAIYKYFKERKERKNSPYESNNLEAGEVKENFGIMDAGLISDTQVYSLFTEYTSIVKVLVGVLIAGVAYFFNRDCENILASYSPVAVDLRFVLSVYKINHELERIADIADGIANYVNNVKDPFPKKAISDVKIEDMFSQCQAMMDNVIEAFEKEDTKIARRVFKQDELLNTINSNGSSAIIENYDQKNAEALFYLLSCVRKLERSGDLTKNIAEKLIFSIESKVIKHRKNKR